MTKEEQRIELEVLARLQSAISSSLARLYNAVASKDYVVCDEVSCLIANSDKMIFNYRAVAKMIEAGTPKQFSKQEADLLDQLQRSMKLVEGRNGLRIVPSNNPEGAA